MRADTEPELGRAEAEIETEPKPKSKQKHLVSNVMCGLFFFMLVLHFFFGQFCFNFVFQICFNRLLCAVLVRLFCAPSCVRGANYSIRKEGRSNSDLEGGREGEN